jgi:hypothetical protein
MSKVEEIKNQLARRLENQSTRATLITTEAVNRPEQNAKTIRRATHSKVQPKSDRKSSGTEQPAATEGVIKLSASLYSFDIECLDRIRDFMRDKGVRNITDSEALRLACRAVKIEDSLMDIYQEMTKDDGRRRKD